MVENNFKQNEVIISLLGRLVFPEEKLIEMITKRKRNPEAYIKAYSLCDGKNSVTDIANKIGLTQPTLTPILQEWENLGLIYETDSFRGKNYAAIYKISLKNKTEKSEGVNLEANSIINKSDVETTINSEGGVKHGQ